jgi:hypothetical protein
VQWWAPQTGDDWLTALHLRCGSAWVLRAVRSQWVDLLLHAVHVWCLPWELGDE